jgi:hypothetical protein
MKNTALFTKLDGYIINFPNAYRDKILAINTPQEMEGFPEVVIKEFEKVRDGCESEGQPFTATAIVMVCVVSIANMVKNHSPRNEMRTALDLFPKYLKVVISDKQARQDAIDFFNEELADLKKMVS